MTWPFGGGEKQPPNKPPDDDSDAPDEELDPEGAAVYWARKLGIQHTPEPDFPDDIPFSEGQSWRERKIQQLGLERFNKLKIHSEQVHQRELAKLQGAISTAIRSGQKEYANNGQTYPVRAVAILGSWAEGTTHTDSDLDFFLLLNKDESVVDDFTTRLRKAGIRMRLESEGFAVVQEGQSDDAALQDNLGDFAPDRILVYP